MADMSPEDWEFATLAGEGRSATPEGAIPVEVYDGYKIKRAKIHGRKSMIPDGEYYLVERRTK